MRKTFLKRCLLGLLSIPLSCAIAHAAVFSTDFNSGVPPGSAVFGTAAVRPTGGTGNSGVLEVTSNANGQNGNYYINDFAGGVLVTNLHVAYRVAIGGGTCCGPRPADGTSFSYTTTLPAPGAYTAEEGTPTGLVVSFDTWDNNGDDTAPAIEVRYNGAVVAFQSMYPGPGNNMREGGRAPAGPVLLDSAGNPVNLQTLGATRNDGSFVNVIIDLNSDNTVSVSYSNVVVFNHLVVPGLTPIAGGSYAFAGRTGGANEYHLVDNFYIAANDRLSPVTEINGPADVTVTETSPASFSVTSDGTWPLNVQWYRNGVAIPGANETTYSIPSTTVSMNGDTFRADISNSQNPTPVSSRTATLTVEPGLILQSVSDRTTANKVYVTYSKPATLVGTYTIPGLTINSKTIDPTNPNVVVLDTSAQTYDTTYTLTVANEKGNDGTSLVPNPSTAKFHYGFGAFCQDFNDNQVPAGSSLTGVATIQNGSVHLTEATQFGICGGYFIKDRMDGTPLDRLQARWRSYIGDGGGGGADGYSFSWGPDVGTGAPDNCPGSEEGVGSGLSVTVDTFDNGGGETGIEIRWHGQQLAFQFMNKDNGGDGNYLRKSQFVDAQIEVLPDGTATFNYDGNIITTTLPGFVPESGWNFAFYARTGGASDNQYVDDLKINCFTLTPPNFTQQPADTTVIEGDNATFTVGVEGAPPLTVQWYTNGVPVPLGTGTSITVPGTVDNSGLTAYVVANNIFGTSTSRVATLTVTPAPRLVRAFMGCEDNIIHVLWNKPVRGDGTYFTDVAIVNGVSVNPANPNEVLVSMDSVPVGTTVTLTVQDEHDTGGFVQYPQTFDVKVKYGASSFCTDFENGLPAGTSVNGVAHIADGIMHLVDDGQNGVAGAFFIPDQDAGANLTHLHMTFKGLIGGVDQPGEAQQFNTGGADGMSMSWGSDVNAGTGGGPDGAGNGLIVTVDTFDNGGGEAPGIEIRYKGNRVAFSPIVPGDQVAAKAYLRKGTFVDAQVDVFDNGLAQFTWDGVTIQGVLPGWAGIAGGNFVFGSSTGGAQDNHWIDNLCINNLLPDTSGPVLNLPFNVVAECGSGPVTWSASAMDHCTGPAAVTCDPASGSAFPLGTSTVTCRATDGTGNTSTGSFTVTVVDTTPPNITCPGDTSAEATGPNGATLTFSTISSDNCGSPTVVCTPASGSTFPLGTTAVTCVATDVAGNTNSCSFNILVKDSTGPVVSCPGNISATTSNAAGTVVDYPAATATDAVEGNVPVNCTPASGSTFPLGVTTVTCTAQDSAGNTGSCSFTVTVTRINPNQPPTCVSSIGCSLHFGNDPSDYVISLGGATTSVVLDGRGSSDADHNTLTYKWIIDGTNVMNGALVTAKLKPGCHSVVLVVSDGQAESRCVSTVCVISASDALAKCKALLDSASIGSKNKRPLQASLEAAAASFARGNFISGANQLAAFQHKASKVNGAAAAAACARDIVNALNCEASHTPGGLPHGHDHDDDDHGKGDNDKDHGDDDDHGSHDHD